MAGARNHPGPVTGVDSGKTIADVDSTPAASAWCASVTWGGGRVGGSAWPSRRSPPWIKASDVHPRHQLDQLTRTMAAARQRTLRHRRPDADHRGAGIPADAILIHNGTPNFSICTPRR